MNTHEWKFIACDPEKCTGCGICEYACSYEKEKEFNPLKSRIRTARIDPLTNLSVACMLCEDAPCVAACPQGALEQSKETGLIQLDVYTCVARQGCSWCIHSCSFGAISLDPDKKWVLVCDLCGGEPKCVEMCPEEALELIARDDLDALRARTANLFKYKVKTPRHLNNVVNV